jgi:hypothetical protein
MSKKQTKREAVNALLLANDDGALFADGFDDAIIGVARGFGEAPVVAYDRAKCIEILSRDMPEDEAEEFFSFNVIGAYVGESTPIYIERVDQ